MHKERVMSMVDSIQEKSMGGGMCVYKERAERREKKKEIDAVLHPRSKSCIALYNKHVNGIRRFIQKLQSQLYSSFMISYIPFRHSHVFKHIKHQFDTLGYPI